MKVALGLPPRPLPSRWWRGLPQWKIRRVVSVETSGSPRIMPTRHEKGYVRLYLVRGHPYADQGGTQSLHRWIKMRSLGKRLDPDLHVHHRNGNKATTDDGQLEVYGCVFHAHWHYHQHLLRRDGRLEMHDCGCQADHRISAADLEAT